MPVTATGSGIYSAMPAGYAQAVSLGLNIRKFREALKLDQTKFGRAVGVGQGAVSRWENSESLPDATELPTIARQLGVSLDELLQGEDAQYDSGRDLVRQGRTRGLAVPREGAPNVAAQTRIRELEGDLMVYKTIVRKSHRLAQDLTALTGRGRESRAATRTKT